MKLSELALKAKKESIKRQKETPTEKIKRLINLSLIPDRDSDIVSWDDVSCVQVDDLMFCLNSLTDQALSIVGWREKEPFKYQEQFGYIQSLEELAEAIDKCKEHGFNPFWNATRQVI